MKSLWGICLKDHYSCLFFLRGLPQFCSVVKKKYVSISQTTNVFTLVKKILCTCVHIVWGSSSRKEILYGVGRATDSIICVCQYPGQCYHSEACMAGVGNDVTHLGTAPHWKYDLTAPLSEPACIEKTSFIRNTNYSFRSMLTRIVAVQNCKCLCRK